MLFQPRSRPRQIGKSGNDQLEIGRCRFALGISDQSPCHRLAVIWRHAVSLRDRRRGAGLATYLPDSTLRARLPGSGCRSDRCRHLGSPPSTELRSSLRKIAYSDFRYYIANNEPASSKANKIRHLRLYFGSAFPERPMPTPGDRIREAREEKDWTQEQLADKAQISKSFLSDVENNKRNVSAENALKIADALGVSLDYLMRGDQAR